MKRTNRHTLLILSTILIAGACSPTIAQRGHILEDTQINKVEIGTAMRSDVLKALGSPTTQSTFNPDIWYYIGQETEKRGILDPQVTDERIVMVTFNKETGIVESIEDIDRDRIKIPITQDKTPTRGNSPTALQQILGNLGKFNAPTQE